MNQKGATYLLLPFILAGAGMIVYLLVSSSFPFKDKLYATLYPKPPSEASESLSGPIRKKPKPTSTPSVFVCNSCAADVNKDGFVNVKDFSTISGCFNKKVNNDKNPCYIADINKDGVVNDLDSSCVQAMFGKSCPEATPAPTPTEAEAKRVFVTSTSYDGNLGGPLGADAKCQERASAVNLGGVWKAWISGRLASGEYQTASSRLSHNPGPYKLLNGKIIANNWDYLTGTYSSTYGPLQNPINVTETQQSFTDVFNYWNVWTNTWASGNQYNAQANLTCNDWTSNSSTLTGSGGSTSEIGVRWTASEYAAHSCNSFHRLYCFEQ